MENLYNQFSKEYNTLYLENILQFQKQAQELNFGDKCFVDFYPSFGIKENETSDFLIYGQAVNGWGSGFNLSERVYDEKIKHSIQSSNEIPAESDHCPLDWVNVQWSNSSYLKIQDDKLRTFYSGSYRTHRSFFWNVTYKLICDYYNIDRNSWDWSKKLVWSNLYKIAPDKANPDYDERNMQQPLSSDLVRKEIEEVHPKYCIVLTNDYWWEPFRETLRTTILQKSSLLTEIVSYEKYNQTEIIVTNRPRMGDSDLFVNQILQLIKK